MKTLLTIALTAALCSFSCKNVPNPLADKAFTDSLMEQTDSSSFEKTAAADLLFWKQRLAETPGSFTALSRYAGGLAYRFHVTGEMNNLLAADSILTLLDRENAGKEAGILRSMASLAITRHRFKQADSLVEKALAIGSEKYASTLLYFDTQFELGHYTTAYAALQACAATNEYGYFFRLSKWKHLRGETDSAIFYMQKAADWAGNSVFLKQTALSNMADLYMHEGQLKKAAGLYLQNLRANHSDHHSLMGLGRIALLNDNDPVNAEKIFAFIGKRNHLPDPLYNLVWVAEQKGDSILQKKYANAFVDKATDTVYGGMYNKYLIELYTGILGSPEKALTIAEKEITNRSTPQTNAWLVWALHKTQQDSKAWELYKTQVSGKPLEALELYWMGKMMADMHKSYNAGEFFKAADKNRFDLSPVKQKDLISQL
jgi:hypothetical protein